MSALLKSSPIKRVRISTSLKKYYDDCHLFTRNRNRNYSNVTIELKILSVKLIVSPSGVARGTGAGRRGGALPLSQGDTNRTDLRALQPQWNLSVASIYVRILLFVATPISPLQSRYRIFMLATPGS